MLNKDKFGEHLYNEVIKMQKQFNGKKAQVSISLGFIILVVLMITGFILAGMAVIWIILRNFAIALGSALVVKMIFNKVKRKGIRKK